MEKKYIGLVLLISVFIGCDQEKTAEPQPDLKVKVVQPIQEDIIIEKDFVAQVYGYRDVSVRARNEGFLEAQTFQEGGFVKKGQQLYKIDAEPLREAVIKAENQLERNKVNLQRAISDLNRIEPLAKINAVSQKELDAAKAESKALEALVNSSKANLNISNLRLSYASIQSPVDGVVGKTLVQVGEFIGRATDNKILTTVSVIDSIRVEFFITENDYLAFSKRSQENQSKLLELPLRLVLSDASVFSELGKIKFINREVDNITGAILVQAIFPNKKHLIKPGQFARARLGVSELSNALLIPKRCVSEVQGNFSVFKINQANRAEKIRINIKEKYKDFYVVSDLKPEDKILYEGLQMVKDSVKVNPELVEFKSQFLTK